MITPRISIRAKIVLLPILVVVFVVVIVFTIWTFSKNKQLNPGRVLGEITNEDLPITKIPRQKNKSQPYIAAYSTILVDGNNKYPLFQKDSGKKMSIASLTKIMTALIVLENSQPDETVFVPREVARVIGSKIQLRVAEKITVNNLLHGLLIQSGNDAAYTLANFIGLKNGPRNYDETIRVFVGLMNQKAKDLNLENTSYIDPAGLDPGNSSTAFDLAILVSWAMENPRFAEIVKIKDESIYSIDGKIEHKLKSSNHMLQEDVSYPYAIGIKTGFTPEAGHLLVSAAKKDEQVLIGVILKTFADTIQASAIESRKLLNWGFENFSWE